jgi:hypothetical protein
MAVAFREGRLLLAVGVDALESAGRQAEDSGADGPNRRSRARVAEPTGEAAVTARRERGRGDRGHARDRARGDVLH